jgi:hypothetical protein
MAGAPTEVMGQRTLLARREKVYGFVEFGLGDSGLVATLETRGRHHLIPAENFRYIPTALVEHLLPIKKDAFTAEQIKEKNINFVKFLNTQEFMLSQHEGSYLVEFDYSQAAYYGQLGLSALMMGGSFWGGPLTGVLGFSAASSMLFYALFQPCQDLNWSSFAFEGVAGAATSALTLGVGDVAKNLRATIKAAKSPIARQAAHFVLNGAASVVSQVAGEAVKAGVKGDSAEFLKAVSPKSLASTVVASGLGGFAGAVAGRASLPVSKIVDSGLASSCGGVHGLAVGGVAGAAGAISTTVIWNRVSGEALTPSDLAKAGLRGVMVGAVTGAAAGSRVAMKYNGSGSQLPVFGDEFTQDACEEDFSIADEAGGPVGAGVKKLSELSGYKRVKLKGMDPLLMYGTKIAKAGKTQTIWTASKSIKGESFLDIVKEKMRSGKTILILSGTHGTPGGLTGQDVSGACNLSAFAGDFNTYGRLHNVEVVNVCGQSATGLSELLRDSKHDEIICAWCWSDASQAVIKTLQDFGRTIGMHKADDSFVSPTC